MASRAARASAGCTVAGSPTVYQRRRQIRLSDPSNRGQLIEDTTNPVYHSWLELVTVGNFDKRPL